MIIFWLLLKWFEFFCGSCAWRGVLGGKGWRFRARSRMVLGGRVLDTRLIPTSKDNDAYKAFRASNAFLRPLHCLRSHEMAAPTFCSKCSSKSPGIWVRLGRCFVSTSRQGTKRMNCCVRVGVGSVILL